MPAYTLVRRALLTFLLVFSGLWILALSAAAVRRIFFHLPHPYNSFLLNPADRFWDFTVFGPRFALWGQGEKFFTNPGFQFTYPAPLLVLELGYYNLTWDPLAAYLLTVTLFTAAACAISVWALPKYSPLRGIATGCLFGAAVLSYPLCFLVDRANIEGLVWIASATGLALFIRRWWTVAAVLLALAASMKIFPGLLLLLFFNKRGFRYLLVGIAAWVTFTLGSLWFVGPTIGAAAMRIEDGLKFLRGFEVFQYHPIAVGSDHSLFAVVKQVTHFFIRDVQRLDATLPRLYYWYAVAVLAAFTWTFFRYIRKLPVLSQLLALSALSVSLSFISYDYTLVHMFVPFAALVIFLVSDAAKGHARLSQREILMLLLPFAVLFTPQNLAFHGIVGFGGQIKAVALLWIVRASIKIDLSSTLFGEIDRASRQAGNGTRLYHPQLPQAGKTPRQKYRVA